MKEKKVRKINNIFRSLLALILASALLQAQGVTKTGTTAGKFLSVGIGPRAIAMGGAFASSANDATAMYWNPAGIDQVPTNQFIFTQTDWFVDIKINYVGAIFKAGALGTLGLNMTAMTMGDMEVTTPNNPEGTGDYFSAGMYAFGFSIARHLTQKFIIGANLKYVRETISQSAAHGVALDIGTVFVTPFYGIRLGTSITNFGTKMRMSGEDLLIQHDPNPNINGDNANLNAYYETESFELPLRVQIGLARDFYPLENQRLTLAVEAAHPNDNSEYMNVGGELALFKERVFIRGGFKSLFMKDREEGLTLGVGYRTPRIGSFYLNIDYAFQDFVHLGDVHTFGFILT
ncbi:MAG TPA: PorV/PorQ family protein, partial [Caldithrix abyssi]|nr:PorV/PorQ family protein [Caldithrix abyssi]